MSGYIVLEGGGEFGGAMAEPDRRAIELAGGMDQPIRIIPTAAAADHNDQNAGANGVRWFKRLGAQDVASVPLIDRSSANSASIAEVLLASRLIYLLGGFPGYLEETLRDSSAWRAIVQAHQSGAVVAGSSAGAMVLCEHYYDPEKRKTKEGLNLISKACVIPHYDTFGKGWRPHLSALLPDDFLIGIDEQTGLIDDGPDGQWNVYGRGSVTLHRKEGTTARAHGNAFPLA